MGDFKHLLDDLLREQAEEEARQRRDEEEKRRKKQESEILNLRKELKAYLPRLSQYIEVRYLDEPFGHFTGNGKTYRLTKKNMELLLEDGTPDKRKSFLIDHDTELRMVKFLEGKG